MISMTFLSAASFYSAVSLCTAAWGRCQTSLSGSVALRPGESLELLAFW